MRRLFLAVISGMLLTTSVGCIIPGYSGDPVRRTQELIYTSENLRMITDDWERFWLLDMPSHCAPYTTHGGIN